MDGQTDECMDGQTDDEKQIINSPPPPLSFSITCLNSLTCRSFLNLVHSHGTGEASYLTVTRSWFSALSNCNTPLHCIQFRFVTFQLSNHFHSKLAFTFTRSLAITSSFTVSTSGMASLILARLSDCVVTCKRTTKTQGLNEIFTYLIRFHLVSHSIWKDLTNSSTFIRCLSTFHLLAKVHLVRWQSQLNTYNY